MPFSPQTLRDHVIAEIIDNASGIISPEIVRLAFLVAADVMDAKYPDGTAVTARDQALIYRNEALTYRNAAEGFAADAEAAAASVDGSLLLTKTGNLAGLSDIIAAIANLGLTNRILRAGSMMTWPKSTPPAGALERNGAAISRTTYADLFAVIGTDYGAGNGTTTFNIPDDRGLFERFWDNGKGYDTGRVFGSYQADQLQDHPHSLTMNAVAAHSHGVNDPGHYHGATDNFGLSNNAGNGLGFTTSGVEQRSPTFSGATTGISIQSGGAFTPSGTVGNPSGGNHGAETRVKSRAYLPIIFF